jgi:hypothetical protein
MEKNRYVFMKIIAAAFSVIIMIQGTRAQTILQLNVNQPDELIADAGSDVSIDVGNNTILGGSPVASGGTGNVAYLWSYAVFLNDNTIARPTAQPPGNVNFRVTVTDERGCTASDDILVIVIGGTLIGETQEGDGLTIYPNPASERFIIKLEQVRSSEINIALIDMSGQVVHQDVIESSDTSASAEIDVHKLSKGAYILRIYGDFGSMHRQIILE